VEYARAPWLQLGAYLQPEQPEAQQSAEAQQDELARAAPASPSASTAMNRIALMLFMEFSPFPIRVDWKPRAWPSARVARSGTDCRFLNAEEVRLAERVSTTGGGC
jgi:hypothetical protein